MLKKTIYRYIKCGKKSDLDSTSICKMLYFCVQRTDSHHSLFTQALSRGALHLQKVVPLWLKMIGQRPGKVSPWQPPRVRWRRLVVVVPSVFLNTEIKYMCIYIINECSSTAKYMYLCASYKAHTTNTMYITQP